MTQFSCNKIGLSDSQKEILSHHFKAAHSNMMPHQLAIKLGLRYSEALAILTVLSNSEYIKSSLLIYHNCDPEVPAGAIPYGIGFPKLPWHCPLCEKNVENYDELSFDVMFTALEQIDFV